ncbi:MAG TPA: hypothetical protein VEP90_24025 [Methylomirabilota bacterium]|nr:hypothetical protein [Methylomirabilota bacterium]
MVSKNIPPYLCGDCAKSLGGVWPEEHRATFHCDICPHCGSNKNLASWDDWDWSDDALTKLARSTREI